MMLPGVEVARRRRVRAGRGRDGAYDGGVSRSETHRSRLVVTGAHHHVRHGNTPTSSRPQPPLRMQENLQQQRSDSPSAAAAAITSSNNRNATANVPDNHDSRPFAHHYRSREETHGSKFSSLWRRHSSCSHSDPSGLAMDARNRLDELLQAAAHATQRRDSSCNSRNSTSRHYGQSAHPTGLTCVSDHHLQENGRRKSVYTWLATCGLSVKQCLNREESTSRRSMSSCDSRPDRSSSSITTSSRTSGLSNTNAMIKTLPRDDLPANEPDQDDCPVCLDGFLAGETTITLQCSHTFHPHCLTPWLSKHDKCPCCRANVTRHKHEPRERSVLRDEDLLSWLEAITQRERDKKSLTAS